MKGSNPSIRTSGNYQQFEIFGHTAALVIRMNMERRACLDIILPENSYTLVGNQIIVPLHNETMRMVEKGILDAELIGY